MYHWAPQLTHFGLFFFFRCQTNDRDRESGSFWNKIFHQHMLQEYCRNGRGGGAAGNRSDRQDGQVPSCCSHSDKHLLWNKCRQVCFAELLTMSEGPKSVKQIGQESSSSAILCILVWSKYGWVIKASSIWVRLKFKLLALNCIRSKSTRWDRLIKFQATIKL